MSSREIHIPLSIQLEAVCLPKLQQTWLMLMPYVPELGALNPRKDPEDAIRQVIKGHLAFAIADLVAYLQNHPQACTDLLRDSNEQREGHAAFIQESEGKGYRVGPVGGTEAGTMTFAELPEAAADYVLLAWGMPRRSDQEATGSAHS